MAKALLLPKAILSYAYIDKPQAPQQEGQKPKYGGAFVFTPEVLKDPKEKALFEAIVLATYEAIDAKWPGKRASLMTSETFKKGFRRDSKPGYPEGSIYINARSENQPGLVYPFAEPGSNPPKPAKVPVEKIKETFYSGAIVRASVNVFAFDKAGNKGVSFGLNNLQFLANGPRLDNRLAAEDEFDVDLSAAPIDDAALQAMIAG